LFQTNDTSLLKQIKFTQADKEFVSQTGTLIKDEISKAQFNFSSSDEILSGIDLSKYTESISGLMDNSLTQSLTDNLLTQSDYMSMFDSSFLNGYKLEGLNQIASLDFLNNDQIKQLTDTILSGSSLGELSSSLSSMSFDYFDESLGQYLSWVPKDLASAAEKLSAALSSTKASFACVCSSSLTSAFDDFQSHIVDDNLNVIYANLNSLNSTIQNNIDVLKSKTPVIAQSNIMYVGMLVEVKKYRDTLRKELDILKRGEK
jgi:hypothetical protein